MDIASELKDKFQEYILNISKTDAKKLLRLTISYENFTESHFSNFVGCMRNLEDEANGNFQESIKDEILEVTDDENITLKIKGRKNIARYCIENDISNIDYKTKGREQDVCWVIPQNENFSVEEFDYPMTVSMFSEEKVEPPEIMEEDSTYKYVLIKDFEYKSLVKIKPENSPSKKDENDFSTAEIIHRVKMVKTNNDRFKTMKDSNVSNIKQNYVFEIDFDWNPNHPLSKKTKTTYDSILNCVLDSIKTMYSSIDMIYEPYSKTFQKQVLQMYANLIKPKLEYNISKNINLNNLPMITPKPITLETINLSDPSEYGVVSILENYAVTEKADGERYLLFIDKDGVGHLINNSSNIYGIGFLNKELSNTILDGELVQCHKRKNNSSTSALYMVFDIYFKNGSPLMDAPLFEEDTENTAVSMTMAAAETSKTKKGRYEEMKSIEKHLKSSSNKIDIMIKEQITRKGKTIFERCAEIFENKDKYDYDIDGLIFTPTKLPVYGYYPNQKMEIGFSNKWDRVFKWKPADQNTIDFIVEEGKVIKSKTDGKYYKEYFLYVGYNKTEWEDISVVNGIRYQFDKSAYNPVAKYELRKFKPTMYYSTGIEIAHIPVESPKNAHAYTEETNEKIINKSVVEFYYINDNKIEPSKRWRPMRVRDDKTRLYKFGEGQISKTANDLNVAMNVWRSIHDSIKMSDITNKDFVRKGKKASEIIELNTEHEYYQRSIKRNFRLSKALFDFHNLYIKEMLYSKAMTHISSSKSAKISKNLLELGCGEGGDMNRWINNSFKFVLGIDFVKHNITNPKNGAYKRMLNNLYRFVNKTSANDRQKPPAKNTQMVFLVGDCGEPMAKGQMSKSIDSESEMVLQYVMGEIQSLPKEMYFENMKKIKGIGSNKFGTVSCMFAIHYFFKSPEVLTNFLTNVSDNLQTGGRFITAFMDGNQVRSKLADKEKFEGIKTINGINVPVWAIIKRYKDYTPEEIKQFEDTDDHKYGQVIDVFIENTSKLIPEYLVDFDLLKKRAEEFGLSIVETSLFEASFKQYNKKDSSNQMSKDDILKSFSFLNRWVIFEKIEKK
jgi:hypothetical protein